MQNITIAGRIGRDAEVRTVGDGTVCGFTVAVDARKGRDKVTNWWRVSLWGKRGEALAQYLTKGASVTVNGEFGLDEYEGKPQLTIRANDVALQGGKQESQPARTPDGSRGAPIQSQSHADALDDDIPFLSWGTW